MLGRLVLPSAEKSRAIVIYVQTAEGATVDQKRPLGTDKTFSYFDVYRAELPKRGPAILISGVGMLLLTMTNRLGRTIDRSRQLMPLVKSGDDQER
jgi:hypothetical protein